ncbi:MAG: T9SS type A sorting domain-containing protein [Bacteroidales bacterium]|nr:T9SS type A sorting domain-containing protein [Bacteroidales bacterium]
MKKLLLFVAFIAFGLFAFSQGNPPVQPGVKVAKVPDQRAMAKVADVAVKASSFISADANHQVDFSGYKGTDIVTIIPIGNSANAYGYGYNNGAATFVWADQNLNTVQNLHRMTSPPHSGNLAIDISVDGGITWEVNREIYNVTIEEYRARYPQGIIYNPEGNTDPNNAYVGYFAASLDGSNGGSWGSYTYGSANIGDPTDTKVHYQTSDLANGYYQGIPTAYTVTQQGDVWMADASLLNSFEEYLGDIIMYHGTFDEVEGDIIYEKSLVPAACDYARYLKMAFSPDGQTGFIFWSNFDGSIPYMDDWSYPLLLKTDDGGDTWADELISIELSGEDGIEAIKNWLSDEFLDELFGPGAWNRDDLMYTTPYFNSDIAVDAAGNPHVCTSVFLCADDPGYIIVTPESFGMFDIYSYDGGVTWDAAFLGSLNSYDGNFEPDDFDEFNRLQVATTWDHTKFFYTWLDTRLEGVDDNSAPDIYARGFDWQNSKMTVNELGEDAPNNVTAFSEAMWQAYFQATSAYVLVNDDVYTIPIVYEDLDPLNVADPVQFKYIQDFSYTDDDFQIVGVNEIIKTNKVDVSQNYPNPFSNFSTITVKLELATELSIEIFNLTGQKVYDVSNGHSTAGTHSIIIDASKLSAGVYFYTVHAGEQTFTKKMIVK